MWQPLFTDKEVKEIGKQFIADNKTDVVDIRKYAKEHNISRSTLHVYLKSRLKDIDYDLWLEYLTIANRNKYIGVVRGGKSCSKKKAENKRKEN